MKLIQRIYVLLGTIFWGVLVFWYTGTLFAIILPVLGLAYVIIGGRIHA